MKKVLLSFLCLACITFSRAQSFYDVNTIQNIEISFSYPNWDYILDTAIAGSEGYTLAQSVTINGIVYDSVGVKYKGNSTYNPGQVKNPFHIALDKYKAHDHEGYTDIKLSNVAKDPSFVREVLSYQILRQYMHAPLSNYANVYVNGTLIGLYASSEAITKKFVNKHFYSNSNAFFKCNPVGGAGPGGGAVPNLVYYGTDSTLYNTRYEMESDMGWPELIELCDSLSTSTSDIEKILDVDRALWMIAFDNVMVNLDSYIGAFEQNYYLYRDHYDRFSPIIWDLNESFGTFSNTGSGTLSTTTAKQQMSHLLHSTDSNWPLVKNLLAIPMYKRMYIAHMRTILNENFASGSYYTSAQNLQTLIGTSVNADVNKFFTYTQFVNNLTMDVPTGMGSAPGLTNLMNARNTWLQSQTDFMYVKPTISAVAPTIANPAIGSLVTFRATVANANTNGVYLGYRYDIEAPFKRISMYDDGAHNDSLSGDGIFGAELPVNSAYVHYYVYAENNNAGMFSPERAEYEYYTLDASYPMANVGEVVINELLAQNTVTVVDPAGENGDYIELYNNSSSLISLANLYLSDNYLNPLKWKFPQSATISPNSYLIVWADEDTTQSGLHANFKLSASGESVTLSYATGLVLDSVAFGVQTADISYQRCPNGTGSFVTYTPTYNAENCVTGIEEKEEAAIVSIYPNPANESITISSSKALGKIELYNATGQIIFSKESDSMEEQLDLSPADNGMYFIRIGGEVRKKVVVQH